MVLYCRTASPWVLLLRTVFFQSFLITDSYPETTTKVGYSSYALQILPNPKVEDSKTYFEDVIGEARTCISRPTYRSRSVACKST